MKLKAYLYVGFVGNEAAVVRYGLSTSMSQSVYKVDIKTYSASDMCESPANSSGFWNPGFIYDVLLSDLRPNMKYYYSFGTKDVCQIFYLRIYQKNNTECFIVLFVLFTAYERNVLLSNCAPCW